MSQGNPHCSSSSSRHFGDNVHPRGGGGGEKAMAAPFEGRPSAKVITTKTQKASTPDTYAIVAQMYRNMGIELSPDDPPRRKKDKGKLVSKEPASNPLSKWKALANAVEGNSSAKNPITKNLKASSSLAPDYYSKAAKFYRDLGIEVSPVDPHLLKKDKGKSVSMEAASASSRKRQLECSAEKDDDDHQRKKMKEPAAAENNAPCAENPRNEDKDDDEPTILFAILDYYSKTGKYPFSDLIFFHHCIKKALRTNVSVSQPMYKIEGLLGKYNNDIVGEHGMAMKLLSLLNACDQEVFEVSKGMFSGYGAEKVLIQGKQQLEEEKRRRKEEAEVCLKRLNSLQERIKPIADAIELIKPIVGACK